MTIALLLAVAVAAVLWALSLRREVAVQREHAAKADARAAHLWHLVQEERLLVKDCPRCAAAFARLVARRETEGA